jgi:hypothetical protein
VFRMLLLPVVLHGQRSNTPFTMERKSGTVSTGCSSFALHPSYGPSVSWRFPWYYTNSQEIQAS